MSAESRVEEMTAFSLGYSSGSYNSAYVSEEIVAAFTHPKEGAVGKFAELDSQYHTARFAGYVLGSYSSFERHEVPEEYLDILDAAFSYARHNGFEDGRDGDRQLFEYSLLNATDVLQQTLEEWLNNQ